MRFTKTKTLFCLLLLPFFCCSLNAQTLGWGDGVNLQPSYYNNGDVWLGFNLMKQYPKIRTLRIEIEPSVPINTVKRWIRSANNRGYKVICTYHKYTVLGTNSEWELLEAARWWKRNYNKLSSAGNFTINLMNEWGNHEITPNAYAKAYNKAIKIVRRKYNGRIIIDLPGWGQETGIAKAASPQIDDNKIVFSVHIYSNAYVQYNENNDFMKNKDLNDLASAGRPVIVGEFGNDNGLGEANWSGLVNHAKSKGWTVLGWVWNGDGGHMNMTKPLWPATPTTKRGYFNVIYSRLRSVGSKEEIISATQFRISPNPAKDFINVTLENTYESGAIEIIDMTGRMLWQQPIGIETSNLQIPINDLPSGTYAVRLNLGSSHATELFFKSY